MSCFLVGCTLQSPKLTQSEVLTIATNAAAKQGYDVDLYVAKRTAFNFTKRDGTWTVFFERPRPETVGDGFLVWIKDANGSAQVMPSE
jgi:hypothetical protein